MEDMKWCIKCESFDCETKGHVKVVSGYVEYVEEKS